MDGVAAVLVGGGGARSPVRIRLFKAAKSRAGWKAKAQARKAALKAATIKIRDLLKSRELWRDRAEKLQAENGELRNRAAASQREAGAAFTPAVGGRDGSPEPAAQSAPAAAKKKRLRGESP